MHYYQLNIGDYASHTRHLSLMEDLAYRRLLDWYYLHEKPLPNSIESCARKIGMSDFLNDVEMVLLEFFDCLDPEVSDDGGWVNKRADAEIAQFKAKIAQASNAGKASAKRRINASSTDVKQPFNECSTDVQPNINQEPLTIKHKPLTIVERTQTARGSRLPKDFEPNFDFAAEQGIHNPVDEASKFRDYWNSQPGQKGVKTDWHATWRNWCRNAKTGRTSNLNKQEALESRNRAVGQRWADGEIMAGAI